MTDFEPDEIEELLQQGFVKAPPTFQRDVMLAINSETSAATQDIVPVDYARPHFLHVVFQFVALTLAGIVGISQALAFVFSLWITSVAG